MKVTAKAPANIALMKFWGKSNEVLRLPMNSSISINLSEIFTITSVDFRKNLNEDVIWIDKVENQGKERDRVVEHVDRIRELAGIDLRAEVVSRNNFPKGTGLASSASGFAALSLAGSKAAGMNLSNQQLSILARLGSGSACRSIPNGWVKWKKGNKSSYSYAYSLYPADYWDIYDVIAVVDKTGKKIGSSEGHKLANNSPFFKARVQGMEKKIIEIEAAIKNKDFTRMGELAEAEAVNMHAVMMTSTPALFYLSGTTMNVIRAITEWRKMGLESYFTIDAGPNVHVLCQKKDVQKIEKNLLRIKELKNVIVNKITNGATLISE